MRPTAFALAAASLFAIAAGYLAVGVLALRGVSAPPVFPPPAVLVAALVAVALHLAPEHGQRARGLFALALVIAALHYLWPTPSQGPLARLWTVVLPSVLHARLPQKLSAAVLALFVLSPTLVIGGAWLYLGRVRTRRPLPIWLGLCGAPVALLPFVSRAVAGRRGDPAALVEAFAELLLGLLLLVGAGFALAVVSRASARRAALRHSAGIVAGLAAVVVLTSLVPWAFGRERFAPWRPGAPTAGSERLFAETLPAWNDRDAPRAPTSEPSSTVSDDELVGAAEAVDPALGAAGRALARVARDGRSSLGDWERRVAELNAASRARQLPFYVDPTEAVVSGSGRERWFRLDTYRIERAAAYQTPDGGVELLEVRRLTPERTPASTLGLSRDSEPRAVVLLDAVEQYAMELDGLAAREPPRCTRRASKHPEREAAILACGALLQGRAKVEPLSDALRRTVARHELQHQLDGVEPPVAKSLASRARASGLALPPRINRELSAYLAEMASPAGAPRLSLVRLLRMTLIDAQRIDGAAAGLALQALAVDAATDAEPPRPERAFVELSTLTEPELRARAARAWQRELGRELRDPVPMD